jgi:hypothetical protein
MHVAVGALKFGGLFERQVHHQFNHARHFLGAILCLMVSGLLRLGEFFVTKGTAGVSKLAACASIARPCAAA